MPTKGEFIGLFQENFSSLNPKPALEANLAFTDLKLGQVRERDIPRIEKDLDSLKEAMKLVNETKIDVVKLDKDTKIEAMKLEGKIDKVAAEIASLSKDLRGFMEEWRTDMTEVKSDIKILKSDVQELNLKVAANTEDIRTLIETTSKNYNILVLVKQGLGLKDKTFAEAAGLIATTIIEGYLWATGRGAPPFAAGRNNPTIQAVPKPPLDN